MVTISRLTEHYITPAFSLPLRQTEFKGVVESVKIIAASVFLHLLAVRFFLVDSFSKVIREKLYNSVVIAPIMEESKFRLILQTYVLFFQYYDDDQMGDKRGRVSRIFLDALYLFFPLGEVIEEYGWKRMVRVHLNALYLFFPLGEVIEEYGKRSIQKIPIAFHRFSQQQLFRIRLVAFMFAVIHLGNPHHKLAQQLIQFTWTYICGLGYGGLVERYETLSAGILIHGLNNALVFGSIVYSDWAPYLYVALVMNQVASLSFAYLNIKPST